MLNLILGGSGSGKTTLIEEKIKKDIENGCQVILLVPEQETVSAERRMLELLPPSAQLSFEVLNFTRLANRVFRQYGGLSRRSISDGVKALTMWNTLTSLRPFLRKYGGVKSDLSLISLMLSASEEFKACCVSPAELERVADSLEDNSTLGGKLRDISLICAAYGASLEEYGDGADELSRLDTVLAENSFFDGMSVYIDSFMSFTEQEHRIISHILDGARDTTAAICCSDQKPLPMHFEASKKTAQFFFDEAEKRGIKPCVTYLSQMVRTESQPLRILARDLWSFSAPGGEGVVDDGSVTLVKCANEYEEAEAAACHIGRLVRGGAKYGEIAVIARNAESWRGIIDHAFEKAGIPFYMSVGTDVSSKPLIKLLLCALRIKNRSWQTEDVISYVKTGLCGADRRDSDLFEDYVWRWSLSGRAFRGDDWTMNPHSYSGELREEDVAYLECVNRARRQVCEPLSELFCALDRAKTNAELSRAIFDYMCALDVAGQLSVEAEKYADVGMRRAAAESVTLYNSVIDILDMIAGFDKDGAPFDSNELEEALTAVFSCVSVGAIPTSCDEVTVGSAHMLRADRPKYVLIIGMNDGVFPKNSDDAGLLSESEREQLSSLGVSLSSDSADECAEELFYVYRAVTCPSEGLYVSYSYAKLQGDGERLPSMAFNRIKLLLGMTEFDFSESHIADRLLTPKIALEYASLLGNSEEGIALRSILEADGGEGGQYYRRLFDSDVYSQSISSETADEIFGDRLSMSPSALEKYVKCHFDYYCNYVLKLKKDERNRFDLSDTGTLVHAVLEEFIRSATDENGFNADMATNLLDTLPDLIEKYARERLPSEADNAKMKHTLSRLKRLSRVLAGNVVSEFKSGGFVPTFFEMKIGYGEDAKIRPVQYSAENGKSAVFSGIVDRVDLMKRGDDVYVKVVDYKTGAKHFKIDDIESGLNVQILLYLFNICYGQEENKAKMGCGESGRLLPAGAVYLSSKLGSIKESADVSEEDVMRLADEQISRSGIVVDDAAVIEKHGKGDKCVTDDSEGFEELNRRLTDTVCSIISDMTGGNASINPVEGDNNPCDFCGMRAVCRRAQKINFDEEDM